MCPSKPHVAVVGAGLMGKGIAACLASGGLDVRLYDSNTDTLAENVLLALTLRDFLLNLEEGCCNQERDEGGSILSSGSLIEAVSGADFVFEAVVEDLNVKQDVFRQIEDAVTPGCILCTNTSSLSITEIARGLNKPGRFCAAHFIGPAHLIPLVELCPAEQTKEGVLKAVEALLIQCGKRPVRMNKEIDGFCAARLQAALYREAMHLVEEGVADVETLDKVVTDGFGRRLNQIGPFAVADFAGVDLVARTHRRFFPQLGSYSVDLRAEALVAEGNLGVKVGKGHYRWTEERAREVAIKRDEELTRRLLEDRKTGQK